MTARERRAVIAVCCIAVAWFAVVGLMAHAYLGVLLSLVAMLVLRMAARRVGHGRARSPEPE
jgi:hypothetical protein